MSHTRAKRKSEGIEFLFQSLKPDVLAVRLNGNVRVYEASPFQQKEFLKLLHESPAMAVVYLTSSLKRDEQYEEHLKKNVLGGPPC